MVAMVKLRRIHLGVNEGDIVSVSAGISPFDNNRFFEAGVLLVQIHDISRRLLVAVAEDCHRPHSTLVGLLHRAARPFASEPSEEIIQDAVLIGALWASLQLPLSLLRCFVGLLLLAKA